MHNHAVPGKHRVIHKVYSRASAYEQLHDSNASVMLPHFSKFKGSYNKDTTGEQKGVFPLGALREKHMACSCSIREINHEAQIVLIIIDQPGEKVPGSQNGDDGLAAPPGYCSKCCCQFRHVLPAVLYHQIGETNQVSGQLQEVVDYLVEKNHRRRLVLVGYELLLEQAQALQEASGQGVPAVGRSFRDEPELAVLQSEGREDQQDLGGPSIA